MKTARFFLAMLLVAATLAFTACQKETINPGGNNSGTEEPTPGPGPQPGPGPEPETFILAGTSWETSFENTYTYTYATMNIDMNISAYMTLDFNDATTGEMFSDITIEVPAFPAMNSTQDTTEAFTYTFDGTTATLTSTGEGAEEGDTGVMIYNPQDTTLYMMIPDEDYEGFNLRDMYGSDRIIFHLIRK